ncbi:MAG: DUF1294 domain-containing protein [Butyrivibrio sp.]|nr:DUF1294 domain-containing protein [Butyrivibrio sp.]
MVERIRTIVCIYLIAINIILLAVMGIDKLKAIRHKWRIPEKTLFLLCIAGGSVGGNLGMYLFHHKLRKPAFKTGFPIILAVHLIVALFAVIRLRGG